PQLHAQQQLPGIVVTTPSPIKRAAPKAASGGSEQALADTQPGTDVSPQLQLEPDFAAVNMLTMQELLSLPYGQLGDVLGTQPGIASSSFAPGASRPIVRGLSGFRVGITENGLMSGDVSAISDDHAVPIDPNAVRQVEVVRGPATLRYGSQAIGG